MQFLDQNLLICANELMEMPLVLWLCLAILNIASFSHCCHCCWNVLPTTSLCSHPLFGLYKCSARVNECQWVHFLPHEEIQRYTFASYVLPCRMPFCQTASLLPSVTQQQNLKEYLWEDSTSTAMQPTSISDIESQHNKIWGITFGAGLV